MLGRDVISYLDCIGRLDLVDRLCRFKSMLLKWGSTHNLTGNVNLIDFNILDSVRVFDFLIPFSRCVDVGSGAGFPSLILACVYNRDFVLLEPRSKRAAFLRHAAIEMGLDNVYVINDFSYKIKYSLGADLLVSRAACSTKDILQNTSLLRKGVVRFLLFKGGNYANEIIGLDLDDLKIFSVGSRNYMYFRKEIV